MILRVVSETTRKSFCEWFPCSTRYKGNHSHATREFASGFCEWFLRVVLEILRVVLKRLRVVSKHGRFRETDEFASGPRVVCEWFRWLPIDFASGFCEWFLHLRVVFASGAQGLWLVG